MKKIVLGFLALMVLPATFAQLPGGKLNLFKYEDKTVSLRVNSDSTFLNLANGVLYSVDSALYLPTNTFVNGLPLAPTDTTSLSRRIDTKLSEDNSATDYARDIHVHYEVLNDTYSFRAKTHNPIDGSETSYGENLLNATRANGGFMTKAQVISLESKADTADYVRLVSPTTQIIKSDLAMDLGKKIFATDDNGTEHILAALINYGAGKSQSEIGDPNDPMCLNSAMVAGWSTDPRIKHTYKDLSLVSHDERLAWVSDLPTAVAITSTATTGQFADAASTYTAIQNALTAAVVYKGEVPTEAALPTTGQTNGDYYVVLNYNSTNTAATAIWNAAKSGGAGWDFKPDALNVPDNITLDYDAGGALEVKDAGIGTAQLSSGVNSSLAKADNAQPALTGTGYVTINAGTQSAVATIPQNSVASLVGDLSERPTYTTSVSATDGEIATWTSASNISTTGYKISDLATAAQGTKADNAAPQSTTYTKTETNAAFAQKTSDFVSAITSTNKGLTQLDRVFPKITIEATDFFPEIKTKLQAMGLTGLQNMNVRLEPASAMAIGLPNATYYCNIGTDINFTLIRIHATVAADGTTYISNLYSSATVNPTWTQNLEYQRQDFEYTDYYTQINAKLTALGLDISGKGLWFNTSGTAFGLPNNNTYVVNAFKGGSGIYFYATEIATGTLYLSGNYVSTTAKPTWTLKTDLPNITDTEQATGRTYNGVPTYIRRFTGNIVVAANTDTDTDLMTGITNIIDFGGTIFLGNSNQRNSMLISKQNSIKTH